jgi:hypothetical protein
LTIKWSNSAPESGLQVLKPRALWAPDLPRLLRASHPLENGSVEDEVTLLVNSSGVKQLRLPRGRTTFRGAKAYAW